MTSHCGYYFLYALELAGTVWAGDSDLWVCQLQWMP